MGPYQALWKLKKSRNLSPEAIGNIPIRLWDFTYLCWNKALNLEEFKDHILSLISLRSLFFPAVQIILCFGDAHSL